MGPIMAFLSGVAALVTSFGIECNERANSEKQWEIDKKAGYSYAAQSEYDYNRGKLYQSYYVDDIIKEIQNDYPKMNDYCARQVAEAAVAKKLLEEETCYKYKPSENCKFFNLEKYAKDKYKKREEDWCKITKG